jgi:hypothetical protein
VTEKLPAVGTKAVHKDDHAKTQGPVWQVTGIDPARDKPIRLDYDHDHKLNRGKDPELRRVTGEEFNRDYVQL